MENEQSEMEMSIAGMDSQIHKSQSKLIEIDVAKATQQRSVIREEKQHEAQIGIGIFNKSREHVGTNSAKTNIPQKTLPINSVGQGA